MLLERLTEFQTGLMKKSNYSRLIKNKKLFTASRKKKVICKECRMKSSSDSINWRLENLKLSICSIGKNLFQEYYTQLRYPSCVNVKRDFLEKGNYWRKYFLRKLLKNYIIPVRFTRGSWGLPVIPRPYFENSSCVDGMFLRRPRPNFCNPHVG